MEEREAIARIKASRDYRYSHYAHTDDDGKAFDMAIKALEKQIAKKAKVEKYSFYPRSILVKSRYGKCPNCGTKQVDDRYCASCGQKLDWSDEEWKEN